LVVFGIMTLSVACMCSEQYGSLPAAAARSEWIFVGKVADDASGWIYAKLAEYRWLSPLIGERHATFEVGEVFKGKLGKQPQVCVIPLHRGCGPMLLPGKEYLVFARKDPQNGHFYTHLCDRTQLVEHANEDLAVLRSRAFGRQQQQAKPAYGQSQRGRFRDVRCDRSRKRSAHGRRKKRSRLDVYGSG
jgi:hypothetical protein